MGDHMEAKKRTAEGRNASKSPEPNQIPENAEGYSLEYHPMGPHVRHWLGVSDVNYRGHSRGRANDEEIASFAREVSARLEELPFESEKQFLDVTMELFSMDLSLLNLKLFDHYNGDQLEAV